MKKIHVKQSKDEADAAGMERRDETVQEAMKYSHYYRHRGDLLTYKTSIPGIVALFKGVLLLGEFNT